MQKNAMMNLHFISACSGSGAIIESIVSRSDMMLRCDVGTQYCWSAISSRCFLARLLALSSPNCYTSSPTYETSTRNILSFFSKSTLSEFNLWWRRFSTLTA